MLCVAHLNVLSLTTFLSHICIKTILLVHPLKLLINQHGLCTILFNPGVSEVAQFKFSSHISSDKLKV